MSRTVPSIRVSDEEPQRHALGLGAPRRLNISKSSTNLCQAETQTQTEKAEETSAAAELYLCEAPVQLRCLTSSPEPLHLCATESATCAEPELDEQRVAPRRHQLLGHERQHQHQLCGELCSRSRPAPPVRHGEREAVRAPVCSRSPLKTASRALSPKAHSAGPSSSTASRTTRATTTKTGTYHRNCTLHVGTGLGIGTAKMSNLAIHKNLDTKQNAYEYNVKKAQPK